MSLYRTPRLFCPAGWPLQAAGGHLPALQTHSSLRSLKNSPSGHPQIAQGKQRDKLRRVPGKALVADLGEAELALDDAKWMLDPGPHAGLELLSLVQLAPGRVLVQCPAFARTHGHMRAYSSGQPAPWPARQGLKNSSCRLHPNPLPVCSTCSSVINAA